MYLMLFRILILLILPSIHRTLSLIIPIFFSFWINTRKLFSNSACNHKFNMLYYVGLGRRFLWAAFSSFVLLPSLPPYDLTSRLVFTVGQMIFVSNRHEDSEACQRSCGWLRLRAAGCLWVQVGPGNSGGSGGAEPQGKPASPSAKWGVHILHNLCWITYFAYFAYFITYFAYFC